MDDDLDIFNDGDDIFASSTTRSEWVPVFESLSSRLKSDDIRRFCESMDDNFVTKNSIALEPKEDFRETLKGIGIPVGIIIQLWNHFHPTPEPSNLIFPPTMTMTSPSIANTKKKKKKKNNDESITQFHDYLDKLESDDLIASKKIRLVEHKDNENKLFLYTWVCLICDVETSKKQKLNKAKWNMKQHRLTAGHKNKYHAKVEATQKRLLENKRKESEGEPPSDQVVQDKKKKKIVHDENNNEFLKPSFKVCSCNKSMFSWPIRTGEDAGKMFFWRCCWYRLGMNFNVPNGGGCATYRQSPIDPNAEDYCAPNYHPEYDVVRGVMKNK